MIRRFTALFLLASTSSLSCVAQNKQAADTPATNSPATTSTPDKSQAPSTSSDRPKKVWTNDDVKTAGSVSVIGDSRNQKYTMTRPADPATIAQYRTNLQKLQVQLNDTNKKLQEYQDFASGKAPTEGGTELSHGYTRTPIDQQIAKLQDKKKQLEQQIDELYESARKHGIESGQLK